MRVVGYIRSIEEPQLQQTECVLHVSMLINELIIQCCCVADHAALDAVSIGIYLCPCGDCQCRRGVP